jgi:uncharacterized RDD family membrane protein YckC
MPDHPAQIDSSVRIVTPENISFQYQVAGPFRRLPAYVVDLSVRFALGLASVFVVAMLAGLTGAGSLGLLLLCWFVLEWFYGGLFETFWNGQTPGKRVTGIRVVRIDGRPVNGLQAVLRNILRSVDLMPIVPAVAFGVPDWPFAVPTFLIGLVTPAFNERFQRLGDLVCGTMVVVEERGGLPGITQPEDPRAVELARSLPAHFQVDRRLGRAVAAYVERRRYFSEPRRREIAGPLVTPLVERLGVGPETSHDLLLCALYHRAFVTDRVGQTDQPNTSEKPPPR